MRLSVRAWVGRWVIERRIVVSAQAMHTLFRSIANGISWDIVVRPLVQASWFWGDLAYRKSIDSIDKANSESLKGL